MTELTHDDIEPGMAVRYSSSDERGNFTGWVETEIEEIREVGFATEIVLADGSGLWDVSDFNDAHGGIELVE